MVSVKFRLGYRTDDPNKIIYGKPPTPAPRRPSRVELAVLQNRTDILQNRTDSRTDLKGLASSQAVMKRNQSGIKSDLKESKNDIKGLASTQDTIKSNQSAIESQIEQNRNDIQGVASTQDTIKSNQSDLSSQIDQNKNEIVEVKQNLEQMLEEGSSNSYREVTIDLSVEHTDESAGILVDDRKYLWLSVVKADGDFTFKLDDAGNPSITGQLGVKLEKHLFTELYYSNPVGTGEAKIIVGWRE